MPVKEEPKPVVKDEPIPVVKEVPVSKVATPLTPTTEQKPRTSTPKTLKLTDLLKVDQGKKDAEKVDEKVVTMNEPFTPEQLQAAWDDFAETRKEKKVEYQLLKQPYELRNGTQIVVKFHNAAHETMLNNLRLELGILLREKMRNTSITLSGEFATVEEQAKAIYTNRDKFEHLIKKYPSLKDLKDKFGLDPEF